MIPLDLVSKALDLLKQPSILGFILLLFILVYVVPLGTIAYVQSTSTDRIVQSIDAQGNRWDTLVTLVLNHNRHEGTN